MLLGLLLTVASALQVPMTPAQRAERSELVVHAEVTSVETRWEADALGGMETSVWLAPIDVLRGHEPELLEVAIPGGVLDGYRVEVDDAPSLVEDRRYLLFLVPDERGRWVVLGGHQGAVRLQTPGLSPGPSLLDVLRLQKLDEALLPALQRDATPEVQP